MSSYNYECFVKDFGDRTLKNYVNYHGEYEVTQLINSMLGLIIVPYELYSFHGHTNQNIEEDILSRTSYYESVRNIIIRLMGQGRIRYDKYQSTHDYMPKVTPLLMRLRNCLAHPGNGIRFYPVAEGAGNVITDVYFIDDTPDNSFVLKIRIEELRELTFEIAKMYSEAEPSLKASTVNRKYGEVSAWADKFLKGPLQK